MLPKFTDQRKSFMDTGPIYFWTATINSWQKLLAPDEFKDIIIESLKYLSDQNKIDVFGFVIMPNHIHLIWRINERNGKESTAASLLKFTAHQFKKMLLKSGKPDVLESYKVKADNKAYEFWKRDSLAIPLFRKEVAFQKLAYMHSNPLVDRWQLVISAEEYKYSSACYYATASMTSDS